MEPLQDQYCELQVTFCKLAVPRRLVTLCISLYLLNNNTTILDVTFSDLWIINYIKIIPASPNYIAWTLPSTAESLGWHAQFASTDSVLLSWSEDKFKYSRSVLSWFVLYSDWFLTVSGAEPLQTRRPSLLLNNRVHQKRLLRSASLSSLSESPDFCTSRIVNDFAKASVCEFLVGLAV